MCADRGVGVPVMRQLAQSLLLRLRYLDSGEQLSAPTLRAVAAASYRAAQLLCERCQAQVGQPLGACSCTGASPADRALSLLGSIDEAAQPGQSGPAQQCDDTVDRALTKVWWSTHLQQSIGSSQSSRPWCGSLKRARWSHTGNYNFLTWPLIYSPTQ